MQSINKTKKHIKNAEKTYSKENKQLNALYREEKNSNKELLASKKDIDTLSTFTQNLTKSLEKVGVLVNTIKANINKLNPKTKTIANDKMTQAAQQQPTMPSDVKEERNNYNRPKIK